jgi:hypothetical protein
MHFEILVEDESGSKMLDIIVPKIIGGEHTFRVIRYKGIGRTPKGLTPNTDASKRILLDQLPRLLRGYGSAYAKSPGSAAVILVCDLDNRCLKAFREELCEVLNNCHPSPVTRFCIAIEEGEAWLLGDMQAVKTAYPKAKDAVLKDYSNDSICGTWERLADAVFPGGARALSAKGWQTVGKEKSAWAGKIAPLIDTEKNDSASFAHFRDKLRELAGAG